MTVKFLLEWWPIFAAAVGVTVAASVWAYRMYYIQSAQLKQLIIHNKVLLTHTHKEDGSIDIDPEALKVTKSDFIGLSEIKV